MADGRREAGSRNSLDAALARDAAQADTPHALQQELDYKDRSRRIAALVEAEQQAAEEITRQGKPGNILDAALARDAALADTPAEHRRHADQLDRSRRMAMLTAAEQQAEPTHQTTGPEVNLLGQALKRIAAATPPSEATEHAIVQRFARMMALSEHGLDRETAERSKPAGEDADAFPAANDTPRASRAVYQFQIDSIQALRPKPKRRQRGVDYGR